MAELAQIPAPHPLLELLGPEQSELLLQGARPVAWRAGRRIVTPGAPAEDVLLLLSGSARLAMPGTGGRQVLAGLFRAPALFGAAEALIHTPHAGELTTLTPAEGLLLPAASLVAALRSAPAIAEQVARDLSARLLSALEQQRSAALADFAARLAQLLLAYGVLTGERELGVIRLSVRLSQDGLARDLGVSRNAIRHALEQLRDLITKERGRFVIRDERALRSRAVASPEELIVSLPAVHRPSV